MKKKLEGDSTIAHPNTINDKPIQDSEQNEGILTEAFDNTDYVGRTTTTGKGMSIDKYIHGNLAKFSFTLLMVVVSKQVCFLIQNH